MTFLSAQRDILVELNGRLDRYRTEAIETRKNLENKSLSKEDKKALRQYLKEVQRLHYITTSQISRLHHDIYLSEIKENLKTADVEKRAENKISKKLIKKGAFSEQILADITKKLPQDIVQLIGQFLPVNVWNELLSVKLKKIITKIKPISEYLLRYLSVQPDLLHILPRDEARSHITHYNGEFNNNYRPIWFRGVKVEARNLLLRKIIYTAIQKRPSFAYKLLKMVNVFATYKKVSVNLHNTTQLRKALVESDLPAEYR